MAPSSASSSNAGEPIRYAWIMQFVEQEALYLGSGGSGPEGGGPGHGGNLDEGLPAEGMLVVVMVMVMVLRYEKVCGKAAWLGLAYI